jgi:hypothetical protein
MLSVVTPEQTESELRPDLDAIVREGARRMLAAPWKPRSTTHLVALVRAGARFERGRLVERPATPAAQTAA